MRERGGHGRFKAIYSDAVFLAALKGKGWTTSSEVAKRVGCSSRQACIRLKSLADGENVEGILKGGCWLFNLP